MRPLAAVAVLSFLAVAVSADTPLEEQHKKAAEQVQGPVAGKGAAAAVPIPVAGAYGTKPLPAAAQAPTPRSSPQLLPPKPKPEEDKRPSAGQVVGGLFMVLLAVPLVLTTGAKLLDEEMKSQPFREQPKK